MVGKVFAAAMLVATFAAMEGAGASPGPAHVIAGVVELADGSTLVVEALSVDAHGKGFQPSGGTIRFADTVTGDWTEVALTCLAVEWHTTPYPIPPWTPFDAMHAMGEGSDGATYFVSIFDTAPLGTGRRDHVSVETEPGPEACGGSDDAVQVAGGDITIAG